MPKQDTFQDLVLGEMREGQELWRWLYTEIRNAIADGRLEVRFAASCNAKHREAVWNIERNSGGGI